MNTLGHENPGACHTSTEDAPNSPSVRAPSGAPVGGSRGAELAMTLQQRNRNAAAELLVAEHGAALGRACMALLGSQREAEDALLETLVAALDGPESFRGHGGLRAWLLGVARQRCARRLTARMREQTLEQCSAPPEAEANAEQASLARRARQLLSEVRPSEREALVLRYEAELSSREVGEACGLDEATAQKRVSRGLSRLRELMSEDES